MYLLPQEIEVWYIIPAIRKELARCLTQEHGLSYEKAGKILGISKAAVSQYLSNKRANKISLKEDTKKEIAKAANIMAEQHKQAVGQMQRILNYMKENKSTCEVCKQYNKDVVDYCEGNPTAYY